MGVTGGSAFPTPEGFRSLAHGCLWTTVGRRVHPTTPEGLRNSLPKVFLLKFDSVLPKKVSQFILKRADPVVLLLILDVFANAINRTAVNRKHSIPTLPGEVREARFTFFYPRRRNSL